MKKFEIKICKKFEVVANSRENALEKLTHDFSLYKLDKKWFSVFEISEEMETLENEQVYGYYVWYYGHLVGENGDLDFNTEDEARKDAEDYIKTGLLEEYNERDRNKFRIEIVSYNKN